MRRAWIVLMLFLLPLSVLAHPGMLDRNSCHYCKQDCELYGLSYAEYHCHLLGDRSVSFSYQKFWQLQRLLRRAKNPTLREVARMLRRKEASQNTISSAKLNDCWPTIDPMTGIERAPLLPRYAGIGRIGELLTAFVCQNPLETVPFLTKEGNLEGGLQASLKKSPTAEVRAALTAAGFSCVNPTDLIACTQWELEDLLVAAPVLKPLVSIASQIARIVSLQEDTPSLTGSSQSAASSAASLSTSASSFAQSAASLSAFSSSLEAASFSSALSKPSDFGN